VTTPLGPPTLPTVGWGAGSSAVRSGIRKHTAKHNSTSYAALSLCFWRGSFVPALVKRHTGGTAYAPAGKGRVEGILVNKVLGMRVPGYYVYQNSF